MEHKPENYSLDIQLKWSLSISKVQFAFMIRGQHGNSSPLAFWVFTLWSFGFQKCTLESFAELS